MGKLTSLNAIEINADCILHWQSIRYPQRKQWVKDNVQHTREVPRYGVSDTGSAHNVVKTAGIECGAFYLREGPKCRRPLGETRRVSELASTSDTTSDHASVAGLIGHADPRLE